MPADLEALSAQTIGYSTLTADQVAEHVRALGARWSVDGIDLKLELKSEGGMGKCGDAVQHATALADEMDHHPSIKMEYAGTTLTIHTHDHKAITMTDIIFAARLEGWLREHGWAADAA